MQSLDMYILHVCESLAHTTANRRSEYTQMQPPESRTQVEPEPRHQAADPLHVLSECLCCVSKLLASVLLRRPAMSAQDD